tara:strand:- start:1053 stop:1445 length:393 start_codon:yes stop_codon:yes gene_type:complete
MPDELDGPVFSDDTLDNNEWVRTDYPDGSIKWELRNPPAWDGEIGPDAEELIGLSQEELYALSVKAQVDVLRMHRESKLSSSDWTQQPDAPITPEKKEEWRVYRQQLRDLTNNITTVEDAVDYVWPEEPA